MLEMLLLAEADWRPWNTVDPAGVTNEQGVHFPVIAIYIVTKNMTVEQHTEGRDRLREAGAPESRYEAPLMLR
jgi:hypothetical protein